MLSLHIVRGPLDETLNLAILNGYTGLSGATVTPENFLRWMQQSPDGPALHALLKTENGNIAGHCSLYPVPMNIAGERATIAKAEYLFVKEEFRKETVQGYEGSMKPAALLLLENLYKSARDLGWCRCLASAPVPVAPLHTLAGLRRIDLPLTECLLTLRPWRATHSNQHLPKSRRLALAAVGTLQRPFWTLRAKSTRHIHVVPAATPAPRAGALDRNISLSNDPDFLAWRYSPSEYFRLRAATSEDLGVIAKRGLARDYLRVCHSSYAANHGNPQPTLEPMLGALVAAALEEEAVGVRWAVYDNGTPQNELVSIMRKMAFLCVRRVRTIYAQGLSPAELKPAAWHLEDSLFCFDS